MFSNLCFMLHRSGDNLHGYFKLCIYENLIEVFSSTEVVEQIIAGSNECDVKIEVTVGVRGGSSKQGQVGESFLSQLPKGSGWSNVYLYIVLAL